MRLLLLSDIHANPWALSAVEAAAGPVDQVLFGGDAVNYGPEPGAVIEWLHRHNAVGVRGNHDQAVAWGQAVVAPTPKGALGKLLWDWTRAQLGRAELAYLRSLPLSLLWEGEGVRFQMVHATPPDPLYDYRLRPEASEALFAEVCSGVQAEVLLLGHTHFALQHAQGPLTVVNPGSVGQPLDRDPRAGFALWEDGQIRLMRVAYDQTPLLKALRKLPLEASQIEELIQSYQEARV